MSGTFPLDWNDWRAEWSDWRHRQLEAGTLQRTAYRFPAKNFLADEVLGVWRIGYRNVELSEVTFLQSRGVGITYGTGAGTEVPDDGVAHSWAELEAILSRDCEVTFQ